VISGEGWIYRPRWVETMLATRIRSGDDLSSKEKEGL
jgi:hypothetical protein